MRYLDFIYQTIVLAGFLVFSIAVLFNDGMVRDIPFISLVAAFLLGPWQMLSSILCVVNRREFHQLKRWHLGMATTYLIALFLLPDLATVLFEDGAAGIAFIVPGLLAIFYYVLTCMWVFKVKVSGNFLRHVSF